MKYFLISLCLSFSLNISAFNDDIELILMYSDDYGIHYAHTIQAKETIYSLAKANKTSVSNIYRVNNMTPDHTLAIGQVLIIPVNSSAIIATKSQARSNQIVKVYYEVKKKENLFQIAKRYFNIDLKSVKANNKLDNDILSPGQMLHIGWIEVPVTNYQGSVSEIVETTNAGKKKSETETVAIREVPISKSAKGYIDTKKTSIKAPIDTLEVVYTKQESVNNDVAEDVVSSGTTSKTEIIEDVIKEIESDDKIVKSESTDIKANSVSTPVGNKSNSAYDFLTSPNLITNKGMALWDKGDNEPLNLFVLHKSAKVGGLIRIENPMLKRVVIAKVIGKLPANVYGPEIELLVSTAVAKSLGVMDSKFLAVMKYLK